MENINIFIIKDWHLGGVKTFEKNIAFQSIKDQGFDIHFFVDDTLSHLLGIPYVEFKNRVDTVDIEVMGKYRNVYHDLDALDKTVLRLESI